MRPQVNKTNNGRMRFPVASVRSLRRSNPYDRSAFRQRDECVACPAGYNPLKFTFNGGQHAVTKYSRLIVLPVPNSGFLWSFGNRLGEGVNRG